MPDPWDPDDGPGLAAVVEPDVARLLNENQQLRRDRDELAEALEREHALSFEYEVGRGTICYDGVVLGKCPVCALLARVKGR